MFKQNFGIKGRWGIEHYRKGILLARYDFPNGITTPGRNHLLDSTFRNQTQISQWYLGLVANTGFTAFAATDTMASHAGWAEWTAYSESARPEWNPVAADAGSISNTTVTVFNITSDGYVKGGFVTSSSVKSGNAGTLWSTAPSASPIQVTNGDILKSTYTVDTA